MATSVLLTGGAGFIGSHLVDRLLAGGAHVTVVDNFDDFYSPAVKRQNIQSHLDYGSYSLVDEDIRDIDTLRRRLTGEYDVLVHIAARAGVRPSIEQPLLYQDVNVRGTHNLLELAREWSVPQFVFASSSSVYGVDPNVPWREDESVLAPISPYASTKVSGELLGHVYSHLFGLRFIALRFFTVYGPRQRPDLAIHSFARKILAGDRIQLFGDGSSLRDYTYVDDIVNGVLAAIDYSESAYEVFNLGNSSPVALIDLLHALEDALGRSAAVEHLPMQPGDVPQTWANVEKAARLLGYRHDTDLRTGLAHFATWLDRNEAGTPW
jgi:UDP-glucuronate 4-epimerase